MITLEELRTAKSWNVLFEIVMLNDTCAPASILSYYLDNIEDNGTIFCPLGYELYKVIGHAMRVDAEAFEAAVETGLLRSAITTYVNAALDVWENWELMKNGVLYIMSDPQLKMFTSCYNQFYVENLKEAKNEKDWNAVVDCLVEQLNRTVPKGYAVS